MIDEQTRKGDPIANALRSYANVVLVIIFGLLPLIFVPIVSTPFEYTKVFVVAAGISVALILFSLSVLRSGVVTLTASYQLGALWLIVLVSFISSLLSGDLKDSLVGDFFSIHSTVFIALLALIPTVWVLLRPSKLVVMRMYIVLAGSTLILVAFHILRLKFGADFLSFKVFTSTVSTPVGTWNDLALFLGLTVILSLVALEQLSLTKIGRGLFIVVTLFALAMLSVINFFTVWIILGLTSLVIIVYTLGKDRFSGAQLSLIHSHDVKAKSLLVALVVFAVSAVFVVGGSTLGGLIAAKTNVSYVEVRPSLEATAEIARNVYRENAFLGIGTNKFIDAWRLYKDSSINLTPFWNTDFNAGNGYITTAFVTTGVLGGLTWIIFLVSYVALGVRSLLKSVQSDKLWYFIAVSSFVSAFYIWGMSIIYVPGVVILLFGALCTGVSLHAFTVINGKEGKTIMLGSNRQTGFMLTLGVITIIITSVGLLYIAGRQYSSVYIYNQSILLAQEKDISDLEREVLNAYTLSSSDVFARRIAEYQFQRMNSLAATANPVEEDQRRFQEASVNGINAAQQAIATDASEPANWSILGNIYGLLASMGVEGARERSLEALTKARELNPKNPLPYLESALVEARTNNYDQAKQYIGEAIALKPNFTEAFFILSQLEIGRGNVVSAIESTRAIITLEPQNPARYYQLGVLESAQNNTSNAISAFEQAVALDQNYANARYLLALAYDLAGRSDEAKRQLEVVLQLNPGNADLIRLIEIITNEGSLESLRTGARETVPETLPTTGENGVVSTTLEPDSPLVNPVNTIPKAPEQNSPSVE